MSYEPSKRLFIGNLPSDCTKKDIIDFLRNRCRNNPSNIEIGYKRERTENVGIDSPEVGRGAAHDGEQDNSEEVKKSASKKQPKVAQYAHLTIEGMKGVIETINGLPLKGCPIRAEPANAHYSIAIRDLNRKREHEERQAKREMEEALALLRKKQSNEPQGLPIDAKKIKNFYYYKQKYAIVASELSAKGREGQVTVHSYSSSSFATGASQEDGPGAITESFSGAFVTNQQQPGGGNAFVGGKLLDSGSDGRTGSFGKQYAGRKGGKIDVRKAAVGVTTREKVPEVAVSPSPAPSKEERKLASLQAKLLALKEKLKK